MGEWTETGGTGRGYSDWEALQAGAEAGTQTVPLFLEFPLKPKPRAVARALRALAAAGLTVPVHEGDRLLTEAAAVEAQGIADWRYRLVGYARRDAAGTVTSAVEDARLLHVGPPVTQGAAGALTRAEPRDLTPAGGGLCPPIAAVVDDGIPILHARFRSAPGATRLLGAWLQADRMPAPLPGPEIGIVLGRPEIDALIAAGDEAEGYRALNRRLLRITERASTDFRVSHGAHVGDIAAGATFDEAMAATRILAVQLPPAAVADTSGRLNQRYVVQALRWCVHETLEANRAEGAGALVANLSLGSLAGPGDATGFLASWLDYEARAYRMMTACDLRIVCAYGNAHRDKLAARNVVAEDRPLEVEWCVQPEDFTPSFLELRAEEAAADSLTVRIVPPPGGPEGLEMRWTEAAGGWVSPGADGRPGAALLKLDEHPGDGRTTALLLACAPTETRDGRPAARAGAWRIEVRGGPALVTALVQRDDTPAGYRILGRQSWLDSPAAYAWDYMTRDWIEPEEAAAGGPGPVTRAGTAVAHAGANASTVTFVGSVKPIIGKPDLRVSTLYSAEGIEAAAAIDGRPARRPGESEGPTLTALADDGSNLYGRIAAAVISGSSARLSGTSVAAPAVARAYLAAYAAQTSRPTPEVPLADLLDGPPRPDRDPIEGWGHLQGQAPYVYPPVLPRRARP